jgi:nucleoside-diphosphate-sugar epimerase
MTKALVTGANGFIGRRLVERLVEQGCEVICVDHFKSSDRLHRLHQKVVRTDVRNRTQIERAVRDVDKVFHLAAAVSTKSLAESRSVNVEGTRTVAEAAAACTNAPPFVYVSSLAVAGANEAAATEPGPCNPISHYGRTKLEAETVLRSLAAQLPITIARPPCVFGAGDRNMLGLYRTVRWGWNVVISSSFRYSFLHVDDLVRGLIACAESGQRLSPEEDPDNRGIYYLADPQPVTFIELADMIAATLAVAKVRHIVPPSALCWTLGAIGEAILRLSGRKTFLNLDKIREGVAGSWVCDASRARAQLGFEPPYELATRIQQTTDSYRAMDCL